MQILRLPSQTFAQESSYTTLNNLNKWNTFTFESDHMTEAISQSERAEECLGNGNECNDLYSKAGNVRYRNWKSRKLSVLSYNIWNMNPEKSKKDNYVRRMKLLKKVSILKLLACLVIFHAFFVICRLFSKLTFFLKISLLKELCQSVKHFGARSGLKFCQS